jgi:hypothetical protein
VPELRILAPTAILGYGYPPESLERGLAADPHIIGVDAGSTDAGPYYLGEGVSFTSRAAVKRDLAAVIRSKNAGPFLLALDLLFRDEARYRLVRDSGALTPARVAALYRVPVADVLGVTAFDAALAIKVTLCRARPAGGPGDGDVYGAQQHAPLLDLPIPFAGRRRKRWPRRP